MNWTRFLLAVVVWGLGASITDWLFVGVLFHNKYLETPEIWRAKPGQSEVTKIIASTAIGLVSCASFIYLCYWTGALSVSRILPFTWLAGAVWRHGAGRSLADALVPKRGAPAPQICWTQMKKEKQPFAGDFVSDLEYNPRPYDEAENEEDGKGEEPLSQNAL